MDMEQSAWLVLQNTDLTEGRGARVPFAICDIEATARRIGKGNDVQGCDCEVVPIRLFRKDGYWHGPVQTIPPTKEDVAKQKAISARHQALKRAKEAGLTDAEIAALGATNA